MPTWYVFVNKKELEERGLSARDISGRGPYAFRELGLKDTHWYSSCDVNYQDFAKMGDNSEYHIVLVSGN